MTTTRAAGMIEDLLSSVDENTDIKLIEMSLEAIKRIANEEFNNMMKYQSELYDNLKRQHDKLKELNENNNAPEN